jgi:four helix bundle protein
MVLSGSFATAPGMVDAEPCRVMGAKRVEAPIVWQLANELREMTHAISSTSNKPLDFRFCSQTQDAASSMTRNIAEGFGRYRHKEFAQFRSFARGSVFELADCLKDVCRVAIGRRAQLKTLPLCAIGRSKP